MFQGIPFVPFHHYLYQWYEKKILQHRGIQKQRDKTDLLFEIYLTFLYLLRARVFRDYVFCEEKDQQYFQHVLYFIYVFGEKLIDSDVDSIMKYCKSIVTYLSLHHPLGQRHDFLLFYNNKIQEEKTKNLREI